jgi:hypothetical protein
VAWVDEGWTAVLDRWERAVTATGETAGLPVRQPPATESELQTLESRIGNRLPPSYRAFLLTTNGLFMTVSDPAEEPLDEFLPASRVQALKRFTALWVSPDSGEDIASLFDLNGNVAAQLLEPEEYSRRGHLLYAIKLDGGYPESDLFLDPLDVDADAEWRVWEQYKETSQKHRSFGDFIDATIRRLEAPAEPDYYKHLVDPSPAAEELLFLEDQVKAGGSAGDRAVERLVELATSFGSAQQSAAIWVLLRSDSPAAQEAVLVLVENHPDDPPFVGNALQSGLGRRHNARVRAALFRALTGPNGHMHASDLRWQWPELVEEVWHITRDPAWLHHLLYVGRPGSLQASIEALADPSLPGQVRSMLSYTLTHSGSPSDPSQANALVRLAAMPENNRLNLACALLRWGEIDKALSLLDESLEQMNPTGVYLFMTLNELALPAAVPILIASLHRKPTEHVLHSLSFVDHPDSAPELGRHLDGPLRAHALLTLEQLGTRAALDVLAQRAAGGDVDAARALARHRDARALKLLVRQVDGPKHRSAVTGLSDLRHPDSHALLGRIAAEDADDNVAVIAAHGLVMARSVQARAAVEALRRRGDTAVKKLADHWLKLLPQST